MVGIGWVSCMGDGYGGAARLEGKVGGGGKGRGVGGGGGRVSWGAGWRGVVARGSF